MRPLKVGALLVGGAIGGCAAFGLAPDESVGDTRPKDAGGEASIRDGGTPPPVPPDAPAPLVDAGQSCSDFTMDDGAFSATSGVTRVPGAGFIVDLVKGETRVIYRTFELARPIEKTIVEIDMTYTTGPFQDKGWSSVFAEYYGKPPELYQTASVHFARSLAGTEVNTWSGAGQDAGEGTNVLNEIELGSNGPFTVTTTWAASGWIDVVDGKNTDAFGKKTAQAAQSSVTLSIGGTISPENGPSTVRLVVRRACVTLF